MDASTARAYFHETFGAEPDVVGSAPGRVNLIGEHTDYNGGQVLPLAIDRRTYVAIRACPEALATRIVSDNQALPAEFNVHRVTAAGKWWDYMSGVCATLEVGGVPLPQFEAVVMSDVPSGSGLSSSAALELSTGIALSELVGDSSTLKQLALLSWRVETQFVGVACGVMDQFASALCRQGHALHLWCDTLETEHVPMNEAVLIFDTASPRSLRASEFNQRRAECEAALAALRRANPGLPNLAAAHPEEIRSARLPPTLAKRALHVAEENERVEEVVVSLMRSGSVPGHLLYESHESLRDNYECSTPELDWFVEHVRTREGVTGARLTGAGWGGCAIAVGHRDALSATAEELAPAYEARFSRNPRTWLTKAAPGARTEATPR